VKPDIDKDDKFTWDMTTVMLLVLVLAFLLIILTSLGPFGHIT
jgi:hypothetical protein